MRLKKDVFVYFLLGVALLFSLYFISAEKVGLVEMPNETGNLGSSFADGINKTLSENIIIPAGAEGFTKYLFNISSDNPIDLQTFIIYFCLWIMLLLLIKSSLEVIPLFEGGWKAWLGAIIITFLASSTGAIKQGAMMFFTFGKLFTKTSILWIVFDFLVLVLLFIGLTAGLKKLKSNMGEERARSIGMKTGMP